MQTTRHIEQRMAQRSVSREMVDFVLRHGSPEQSRLVVGRKEARQILASLEREVRVARRILGKGGLIVVAEGEALVTTYARGRRRKR